MLGLISGACGGALFDSQSARRGDRFRLRRRQTRGTPTITPGQGWSRRPHNVVFACWGVLGSRVRDVGGGSGLFQGCSGVFGRGVGVCGCGYGGMAAATVGFWTRLIGRGGFPSKMSGRGLVYGGARVGVDWPGRWVGVFGGVVSGFVLLVVVRGGVVAFLGSAGSSGLFEVMDDGSHENGEGVGGETEHAAGSWVEAPVVFDHAVDTFDRVASATHLVVPSEGDCLGRLRRSRSS